VVPVERILLLEDETELAEPLGRVLHQEGYWVDLAHDGTTAHTYWQTQRPYSLLILDWMVPPPTGLELCTLLRQAGDDTPVLFLTARDTLDDRVCGLDAGADDYLVKPFELRELLARVRALLRRRQSTPSTVLCWQDLRLDLDNRLAYRGQQCVSLSEKEMTLLALFLQHPTELLTHEFIAKQLWPGQRVVNRNLLAAQIRLLRRKIEHPGEPSLIQTIYGQGYCLRPLASAQ
jgi:OmpR-family two-component system manganese-sensing response regulator